MLYIERYQQTNPFISLDFCYNRATGSVPSIRNNIAIHFVRPELFNLLLKFVTIKTEGFIRELTDMTPTVTYVIISSGYLSRKITTIKTILAGYQHKKLETVRITSCTVVVKFLEPAVFNFWIFL